MKSMKEKEKNDSQKYLGQYTKICIMAVMLLCCFFLIYYMHFVFHFEGVYTHIFYIPIILGAIWWKRKGLSVPIILALMLLTTHFLWESHFPADGLLRSGIFLLVSIFTAEQVRYRDKAVSEKLESEEKYRELSETIADMIFTINLKGEFTYLNPECENITGFSADEFIGRSFTELVMPECLEITVENFKKGISGEIIPNYEIELRHKDGKSIPVELNVRAMHDSKDNVIGRIGVARDISQRKKMELVMFHIMKQLEEKNKELEDYTYTVSHDLKAPLVTIQGFSELLGTQYADQLDDKAKHYLDRINQGSDNLARLVSDLLELSRAGRKTKDFELHDFNEILGMSLDGLEAKIVDNNVKIEKPDDFPEIYCDDMRLSQVISNLIGNSINYMGDGKSSTIQIGWAENDGMYEFWVQDNGVGIRDEDKDRIFNIFERAAESSAEGTGIGLSIVKKIIHVHGGDIWVESEFGYGSKFTFTIPVGGNG